MALLVPLLGASAMASASETALFSLTWEERSRLRRTHPAAHQAVAALLGKPRRLLILVLLLNMLVNVTYFVISSVLSMRMGSAAAGAAVGVGSLLAIILFGEVLAKLMAVRLRSAYVRVVALPLVGVAVALGPLLVVLDRFVISPLSRVINPDTDGAPGVTIRELSAFARAAADQGHLDDREQRLLDEILDLGLVRVREVMTPRVDLDWLDIRDDGASVRRQIGGTRLGVYLVVEESLDRGCLGLADARRVLAAAGGGVPEPVRAVMRSPTFLPEQARLDMALSHFRRTGGSDAVCVDERGNVSGLLTASAVVNELVFHGTGGGGADQIRLVGLNRFSVPGRLGVRDFCEYFQPEAVDQLPGRVSTIGGLIGERLGRVPSDGDETAFAGLRLRVRRMRGRSVEEVEVEPLMAVEGEGGPGSGDGGVAGGAAGGAV